MLQAIGEDEERQRRDPDLLRRQELRNQSRSAAAAAAAEKLSCSGKPSESQTTLADACTYGQAVAACALNWAEIYEGDG